jgi:predicted nucleotidyltransferase
MNRLVGVLRRLARELDGTGVPWALVGGLAVSAHTQPRFTRDIDIALSPADDAAAERLVDVMLRRGYRVVATLEQPPSGRLATVRLLPPGEDATGIVVDLLFASSGVEREISAAAERIEVASGLVLAVATVPALLALKVLSRDDRDRPQDVADLRALLRIASPSQLDQAWELLATIEARGFSRGRRLSESWEALLRERP